METVPMCLELARVTEIDAGLRELLDKYGTSPIREPISFLDKTGIKLDELQFLRLPADFFQRPRKLSLKALQDHCRMASLSEIFYRCVSAEKWLRTVIESRSAVDSREPPIVTIRSNVLPREAYLRRGNCRNEQQCRGGFFRTSILPSILRQKQRPPHPCEDCALAEHLQPGRAAHAVESAITFWFLDTGDVELVEDLGTGSEGAVSKILWRKGTFARKRFRCRVNFDKELDVALHVSHPNIVHFFGYSLSHRDLYMEFLNRDLAKAILEGARVSSSPPFSFHDALDVLLQIAQAMRHLHEKNYVHGDLKPQNILLDSFTLTDADQVNYHLVKLADFGCAQLVDNSTGATVAPFNASIGTLKYTAPEVLRCRKDGVAPAEPKKVDVYSFGVVAFQVLTGVGNLYADLRNSEIAEAVMQGRLRPDSGFRERRLGGDARSLLLPLVRRCWTPYPHDRPSFSDVCSQIQLAWNRTRENKTARWKGKWRAF